MKQNSDKKYDFKGQLDGALEAEKKLHKIFVDHKFELKTESNIWHDTGNIFIEYESHDKPSGIAATEADYWVHELRTKDKRTLAYITIPTPILKEICNDLLKEGVHSRRGGEGKKMEMLLLNLETLFTRLSKLSGDGHKEFVSPKETVRKLKRHIKKLKEKMDIAIKETDFESAIVFRDEIKALEQELAV